MYQTARSQRNFFGPKEKKLTKMRRASNSRMPAIASHPKGYLKILKLHGMFLVKCGFKTRQQVKAELNVKNKP